MTLHTTLATVLVALTATVTSTPRISAVHGVTTPKPTPQTITIAGTGLMNGLSLQISAPDGTTQMFKDIKVEPQEDAAFKVDATLATPGAYVFIATNTDGGVSQPFRLDLKASGAGSATPTTMGPVIDGITPARVNKQTQPQVLTLDGKRFMPGLIVTLNDAAGNSTTVSGNAISNMTQNSFSMSVVISVEGEYTVTVTNPDGQVSNAASLSVRGASTSPRP